MPDRKSRKRREEEPKVDLKSKLKQKLLEKKLERTCQFVRDSRLDRLEDKLEETTDPNVAEKLKAEIALLESVDEKVHRENGCDFP